MRVIVSTQCPDRLTTRDVELPYSLAEFNARFHRWERGTLIHDAFPELDASQRRAVETGICDDCFTTATDVIDPPF